MSRPALESRQTTNTKSSQALLCDDRGYNGARTIVDESTWRAAGRPGAVAPVYATVR